MSKVFDISGYSDDLIEIEGDLSEELNYGSAEDEFNYIACYDGTLLSVIFDDDGIWHFRVLAKGHAYERLEPNDPDDEDAYSDRVRFIDTSGKQSNFWFVIGEQFVSVDK